MKLPNKYITIIFILTISYAVYSLVIPSSKKKRLSTPHETTEGSTGALGPVDTFEGKSVSKKDANRKEDRRIIPWGKDPFMFPKGLNPYQKKRSNKKEAKAPVKKTIKVIEQEDKLLSIKVTSILISEDQRVATIDRVPYVVTIGDRIDNEQVLEILRDRVILGKDGRKRAILLKSHARSSENPG
jgi:hypothetical protein